MEENPPKDEKIGDEPEVSEEKSSDKPKRLKMSDAEDQLEESSSSDKASTSTENPVENTSPAFKSLKSKTRNYRNSRNEPENDDSNLDTNSAVGGDPMEDTEQESGQDVEMLQENSEDNEWEDIEGDEENQSSSDSSSNDDDIHFMDNFDSDSNPSTVTFPDSDSNMNIDEYPLFNKEKPKNNWFALQEINRRQLGYSSKLQSQELFQRHCYGSLHCVKRLELMYKLEEHVGCVNSLNFHPNGDLLASGSDDLTVVIWDWKIGKSLLKYKTKHKANIFQSKFLNLSGDLHVVTCARDGQVC